MSRSQKDSFKMNQEKDWEREEKIHCSFFEGTETLDIYLNIWHFELNEVTKKFKDKTR